jgi:hypothetical protein
MSSRNAMVWLHPKRPRKESRRSNVWRMERGEEGKIPAVEEKDQTKIIRSI